jgi:class 3 adenylate cyclase/putative methionine-R-sulfoxide reductase with GAF domain
MRRRSRTGSEPAKARRRKMAARKRRTAPTVRGRGPSGLKMMVALLARERDDALERQSATNEVLRVIASSPNDTQPVFNTIVTSAARLCKARHCSVFRFDGKLIHFAAEHGLSPEYIEAIRRTYPIPPGRTSAATRAILTGNVAEIPDVQADPDYAHGDDAKTQGFRSLLAVPMLKDGQALGAIVIAQTQRGRFPEQQIQLLRTFADQAVIAIENVRLFEAEQQRSHELSESLEQQTATSEVLKVIGSSPGELDPVFQTMLAKAIELCEASYGAMWLREGDTYRNAAFHGDLPPAFVGQWRSETMYRPRSDVPLALAIQTRQPAQVADMRTSPSYLARDPLSVSAVEVAGIRTLVAVPLLRENEPIGTVAVYRKEVRPFTNKQIALVQNFAAQAVIAVENTRLLNELRERTEQLEMRSQEVVKLNQQLEQRVADQVGEIERMSRLRRFLPPQVADLIVASGAEKQLESHRREITALFCDLRGYTGFSESSDPEDVMALLRDYHAAIGEIIFKYSGTLERFAGDGVMVIFNDPVQIENPALQAVLMALDMRTAIGTMIEKWRDLGHDLGFGIGIAHGFATLGTIGFEGRFDYAAIGTVSNVASRLCDEAKPGQILISPRVRQAVEKGVTVEPVGEFTLKGIRRPMMTYNVLEGLSSKPN